MGLQQLKKLRQREGGFTIIELLIVIVVIGILAAITIVAYNGVTLKAKDATARGNAESVQKVTEAYNADNGTYPSVANLISYAGSSQLPSSLKVAGSIVSNTAGVIDGSSATACNATSITATCLGSVNGTGVNDGTKNIIYVAKSTTGACIGWYDYSGSVGTAGTTSWVYAGNASTETVASGVVTCS